ncbi:MAG: glycosyltransferase family 39 protein, partial [Thermodesulfobacteriota bacterium]
MNNKLVYILLALILLGSVLVRLPVIDVPLERDEGEYAYIAWRLEHGEVPYKDIFDQKPPGIFFIYYVTFLFSDTTSAIHWMVTLYTLITLFLAFCLSRRLTGSQGAGLITTAALASALIQPALTGQAANTEIFMIAPIIGALLLFTKEFGKNSALNLFGVGLLIGIASLLKQVALTTLLPVAAISLWSYFKTSSTEKQKKSLFSVPIILIGTVAAWVPALIYFISNAALADMINAVFLHNFKYLGTSRNDFSFEVFFMNFLPILKGEWPLWAVGVLGIYKLYKVQATRAAFALLWLVSAAIGISASAYFFPHYFIQATPVLALLTGAGVLFLYERAAAKKNTAIRAIAIILSIWIVSHPLITSARVILGSTPAELSYKIYPGNMFPDTVRIADYINSNSKPTDP